MKAYELIAKINRHGELEIPKLHLKHLQENTPVRIIVLVHEADSEEDEETGFSADRFQTSWEQAVNGETLLLDQLWE